MSGADATGDEREEAVRIKTYDASHQGHRTRPLLGLRRRPGRLALVVFATRTNPWLWLAGGTLIFFLVPLVGTEVLGLQPDTYYLIYFTVAVLWFAVFVRAYAAELRDLWRPGLGPSLAVGAAVGTGLVAMVLSQPGTGHPDGWRFAFEIIWRGLVYGSVDALTLFVFPAAVAHLLMHGRRTGAERRAGFAGLAVLLSLLVSTSYTSATPSIETRTCGRHSSAPSRPTSRQP